jgi:hypothetical protein
MPIVPRPYAVGRELSVGLLLIRSTQRSYSAPHYSISAQLQIRARLLMTSMGNLVRANRSLFYRPGKVRLPGPTLT